MMNREEVTVELPAEAFDALKAADEDELLDLLPEVLDGMPDDSDPLEDIVVAVFSDGPNRHAVEPGTAEVIAMMPDRPGALEGQMIIEYRANRVEAFRSLRGDGEPRETTVRYRLEPDPPQLVIFADLEEEEEEGFRGKNTRDED